MVYKPCCFLLLNFRKKEVSLTTYVLVQENYVLLDQIYWISKVYHCECFRNAWMINFHMDYMKKRLVLVYSVNIVYGHYILWVDFMTYVVFQNNLWWPWVLPVNAKFVLD